MTFLKPQDPIDVLKDPWPGCPVMAVRTYNILRRMGVDTIQQLLDVDIDAVVAERNSGHRTVEQVTCYQQQIPASLVPTHQQAEEEKSEQRRRTVADLQEQDELDDDGKAKLNMWFLGTLAGLHQKVDVLRGTPALDHNVEQAQIALEVASMRLGQVQNILADNLEAQQKEAPSAD